MVSPDVYTPDNVASRMTMENLRLQWWRVNQIIVPRMGAAGGRIGRSPARTRVGVARPVRAEMADAVIPIVQQAYDFAVALYGYANRFPRMHTLLPGCEQGMGLKKLN